MKKVIGLVSGLSVSGGMIFIFKYSVRHLIRSNPEKAIEIFFEGTGFLIIQSVSLIKWMFSIFL